MTGWTGRPLGDEVLSGLVVPHTIKTEGYVTVDPSAGRGYRSLVPAWRCLVLDNMGKQVAIGHSYASQDDAIEAARQWIASEVEA